MIQVSIFIAFFGGLFTVNASPSCIGENGNSVDMYIIYKLPRSKSSNDDIIAKGKGYIYLDSESTVFRQGKYAITDENSPTGRTLNQVYKNESEIAFVFYNDDNPVGHKSYGSYGHSKGALGLDTNTGFWLIHSVPRFPSHYKDGYIYPKSGFYFGQTMICVSFGSKKFEEIAKQLIYNHPHIHDFFLPNAFHQGYPNMKRLTQNKLIRKAPFQRVLDIQSLSGAPYRHFAKDNQFKKDLYRDFVALNLKTALLTETWQRGRDIGASCETTYTVEDISKIDIVLKHGKEIIAFNSINDHSKFAIGKSSTEPIVCIGDINRQPSQFKRGGGTLCFKHTGIWKQFHNFVKEVKGCPTKKDVEQQIDLFKWV